ncbi:copper resistance CopC/CopD family protein [Gordonia soli]|uniref:Copper resistance protein n=1 Tax=Gordonia soli NBRC 108243 TaxID=1223545 RepID=M0QDS6_9ACTN|nr:CopD family protein [Gordonia soli]GAC66730.1 hypothetical protein GS4_03_01780 [Gordonia soli NBRC 108243]
MTARPTAVSHPGRARPIIAASGLLILGLSIVAVALSTALAAPASAHAYILTTSPANGATVQRSPTEIVVTLSEPVSLGTQSTPDVIGLDDGRSVATGRVRVEGPRVIIGVRPDLPDGVYLASWRVISADTHAVAGAVQFGVRVPASAAPAGGVTGGESAPVVGEAIVKALAYAVLVALVGIPLAASTFLGAAAVARAAARRRVRCAVVAAFAVGVGAAAGQWAVLGSTGVDVAGGRSGTLIGIRVLALAGVVTALVLGGRAAVALTAGAGLVAIAATTGVGHGGAGSIAQWLWTVLHASSAVYWLGGLVVLAAVGLRSRLSLAQMRGLRRWSFWAAVAVAILIVSGIARAVDTVGAPAALFDTGYGRLLLVKVAAVLVALAIAALALRWSAAARHTDEGRPEPGATARLRRRVRVELAVTTVALLAAVVLSNIAPATATWRPVSESEVDAGPYRLSVRVDPARPGPQQFTLRVRPTDAEAVTPAQVAGVLADTDGGVGGLVVDFPTRATEPSGPGQTPVVVLHSTATTVPTTGRWRLQVTVVVDRWRQYVGAVDYDVR